VNPVEGVQNGRGQIEVLLHQGDNNNHIICIKRVTMPNRRRPQGKKELVLLYSGEHSIEALHDQDKKHGRERITLLKPATMADLFA
jgi:hypothetical protein